MEVHYSMLATVQTFKTFGPSKLSDLQKPSDLHVEALSQHALYKLLLTLDIIQSDNYHPNILTIYLLSYN